MLYHDRIDFSEGLDVNRKTNKKVQQLSLLVFLNKVFKFQSYVYNRFYNLLMTSKNLSNIAILNIKGANCAVLLVELTKMRL